MTDTTSMETAKPLTSGDFTARDEPFSLFGEWLGEAFKSEPADGNAMTLATVDADGQRGDLQVCHRLADAE